MPSNSLKPFVSSNLVAAQAALAATASSAAFVMPAAESYSLVIDTSAATGTSPTLDVVLQTSYDGGTTFIDLPIKFTQITAASIKWMVFRNGLGMNEVAAEAVGADTGALVKQNCNFDPYNMKLKYTVGGTNPSFAFKVHLFASPRGTNY